MEKIRREIDTPYISDEELHFSWYLDELREHGFISGYDYDNTKFKLSDKVERLEITQLKTKEKEEYKTILQPNTYSPDFDIYWTEKAEGIFISRINKVDLASRKHKPPFFIFSYDLYDRNQIILKNRYMWSHVDVKPSVDRKFAKHATSLVTFPIEQKWVFDKYAIYVQDIKPYGTKTSSLFAMTFTPERFLYTDVTLKARKINHKVVTLKEYLNKVENE